MLCYCLQLHQVTEKLRESHDEGLSEPTGGSVQNELDLLITDIYLAVFTFLTSHLVVCEQN